MPVPSSNWHPKTSREPASGFPRTRNNPESTDAETLAWNFHRLDTDHPDWGWNLKARLWRQLLDHLKALEGLTWAELKQQAGGKNQGTNHHPIPVADLSSSAQKRLEEINLDDFSTVFSLRLANTLRLYGVRDGRVLRLIWYDPHHGTGRGACPTKSQHKKSSA